MRVVIDTNVVVSAIFFGGKPLELIKLLLENKFESVVTPKIISEYCATANYLLEKYNGKNLTLPLSQIISQMNIFSDTDEIHICRDPDDNKFISCAKDSCALYIVSGDKDLLSLNKYENIEIVTVAEFLAVLERKLCEK